MQGMHVSVKWTPGASAGILVAGNGSSGYSSSQLLLPLGITVDSQSNILYIADYERVHNYRLAIWCDSRHSCCRYELNIGQHTVIYYMHPWGIIRDTYGNLYVADYLEITEYKCSAPLVSSFSAGKTIAGIGVSQLSSRGLYVTDLELHLTLK